MQLVLFEDVPHNQDFTEGGKVKRLLAMGFTPEKIAVGDKGLTSEIKYYFPIECGNQKRGIN